jgi:hypothetical protein
MRYEWQMRGDATTDADIQERWRNSPAGRDVIRRLIIGTPLTPEYPRDSASTTMGDDAEFTELDEAV